MIAHKRPFCDWKEKSLARAKVSVNAGWDGVQRPIEPLLAFFVFIFGKFTHNYNILLSAEISGNSVKNTVEVIHHGNHSAHIDVALAKLRNC